MIVHKFGGSAFKNKHGLTRVLSLLDPPCIVVISAAYGVTAKIEKTLHNLSSEKINKLIQELSSTITLFCETTCSFDILYELEDLLNGALILGLNPALSDHIMSYGERLMIHILSNELSLNGIEHNIIYPERFLITNGVFSNSKINLELSKQMAKKINWEGIVLVPGYYGISQTKQVTLLGGSGTDYSATAIGYLVNAEKVVIWKDVRGFMSADPNKVSTAKTIPFLSYTQAELFAIFGAEILHPMTIDPARIGGFPIEIRDIRDGTLQTIISSIKQIDKICITSREKISKFNDLLKSNSTIPKLLLGLDDSSTFDAFIEENGSSVLLYISPASVETVNSILEALPPFSPTYTIFFENGLFIFLSHTPPHFLSKIYSLLT